MTMMVISKYLRGEGMKVETAKLTVFSMSVCTGWDDADFLLF